MKLALICTERLPSPAIRGGAIQTMIDGVAPFLKRYHRLTIFSVTDPELPEDEVREDIRYIRIPEDNYASGVAERLAEDDYDVVHVFNRPVNVPLYKEAAPDSKIVLGLHNEMFHENKISADLGRQVVNDVSQMITVSHFIKNTVTTRFPEAKKKCRVVYSGVDLEKFPPVWSLKGQKIREDIRRQNHLENHKVILFAGRLSKNKGAHVLIHAMRTVLKKHDDAILVIAGGKWFSDNGMNRYIRALHELAGPIKDRIMFTQFIPYDQMPEWFLAADVFVCPSQWEEPLARVHYETMAAGVPVITTNRGGNAEVILHRQNGLLVNNYNSSLAFAKAIDFLLSNPENSKWIARNGREFVETHFQFSHVAEQLEHVYQLAVR